MAIQPKRVTPPPSPKKASKPAEVKPGTQPEVQPAPGPAAVGKSDTPPKPGGKTFKGEPQPKQPKKSTRPPGRPVPMEKQLTELFEGLGTIVFLVNNEDGIILTEAAPKLAHAYANLAKKNEVVKRILENMLQTSAWSEAVVVTGLVALPIAQNHGLIPAELPLPSFDMSVEDATG